MSNQDKATMENIKSLCQGLSKLITEFDDDLANKEAQERQAKIQLRQKENKETLKKLQQQLLDF